MEQFIIREHWDIICDRDNWFSIWSSSYMKYTRSGYLMQYSDVNFWVIRSIIIWALLNKWNPCVCELSLRTQFIVNCSSFTIEHNSYKKKVTCIEALCYAQWNLFLATLYLLFCTVGSAYVISVVYAISLLFLMCDSFQWQVDILHRIWNERLKPSVLCCPVWPTKILVVFVVTDMKSVYEWSDLVH